MTRPTFSEMYKPPGAPSSAFAKASSRSFAAWSFPELLPHVWGDMFISYADLLQQPSDALVEDGVALGAAAHLPLGLPYCGASLCRGPRRGLCVAAAALGSRWAAAQLAACT